MMTDAGVIHLLPELQQGGVEEHVIGLASAQASLGRRVAVVSGGGRLVDKLPPEVPHVKLPVGVKNPLTALRAAADVAALARRDGHYIVHAHSRVPSWVAYLARRAYPKLKFIYTVHAIFSRNFGTWPISRADGAICVSRTVRDDLDYRLSRVRHVRVMYNPLPRKIVPWAGSGSGTRHMLFAGRLDANKNLATVLDALAPLAGMDWTLDVCGAGSIESELREKAVKLGLADRVAFLGYVSDVAERLAACDLFLFPSFAKEGLSLVLIEALSSGTPVLASDIPQNRELIAPDDDITDTGELIAPLDISAWTHALERFISGQKTPAASLKAHLPTERELAEQVLEFYGEATAGP